MTELLTERMTSYFMTEHNLMKMLQILMSDFIRLAKSLIKLAEENGVNKEAIQKILKEETKAVYLATGKHWRIGDLHKG